MPKVSGLLFIPGKEKTCASNAGLFHFSGFCRGRGIGLDLEWLPADCATHCLPQALCICTSVTRCEYIRVSSAPTSMLATVTDAHMPGDLVQSAGEVFWLSSLFLIPRKEKARASNAGLFHFCGFCRGRGIGLGLEWLPADCATHCLPQALCICTSVTRCEYILVSSAPTSMLATVTDAHMPGDLVQSAGEVLWLSLLFRPMITGAPVLGVGGKPLAWGGGGLY